MYRGCPDAEAAVVDWSGWLRCRSWWANPASAGHVDGSCVAATQMPCTASGGQAYGGTVLGADGNDDEASVEAVLEHLLGGTVAVSAVAGGVTADVPGLDVTPDEMAGARAFDWVYSGPSASLAYITVKAADAFALFGVAGTTSGRIDVGRLLDGHEISHVGFWAATTSLVAPVRARKLHGRGFLGNTRLAEIKAGKVGCVHVETAELAFCRFGRHSGNWLETASGDFAVANQPIALDGEPGGEYVVAARVNRDGTVPGLEPAGQDSAGTATGMELAWYGVVETLLSSRNASGRPLVNYATKEVCSSSYPHPDGVTPTRSPSPGIYCYTGTGAALNDINGWERGPDGRHLSGWDRLHIAWVGGYEIAAAKRPAVASWPAPGRVVTTSLIVWRSVAPTVTVAN
jgi:hypothetical protein